MSRIMTGLLSKGLLLARGFGTSSKLCQETSSFVHPEKRRSFPIVFSSWNEVPTKPTVEKEPSNIIPQVPFRLIPGEARRSRRKSLRQLVLKKEHSFLSDMYRWSEFRRRIIYGRY